MNFKSIGILFQNLAIELENQLMSVPSNSRSTPDKKQSS